MNSGISEIEEIENEINIIERRIKELWNNVMIPYLQTDNRQILTNLDENDYNKFYSYMIKKNMYINDLYERYYELQK